MIMHCLKYLFLGEHETADWPCHLAKPSSCHRPCGRILECENHTCSLPCHLVESAPDEVKVMNSSFLYLCYINVT